MPTKQRSSIDTNEMLSTLARALREDIGSGDITSSATLSPSAQANAQFLVKTDGVIAGVEVARHVFALVDKKIVFKTLIKDGSHVKKGDIVATVNGSARSILMAERVALNFMQRMSGIATTAAEYVVAIQGTHAKLLDTRKTIPGLRLFDKWAVRLGGGYNHRFGLYDMAMIKDNHIAAVGSITNAVERIRAKDTSKRPIEVEVKTLEELQEALPLLPTRIMLDNMSVPLMKKAVELTKGKVPLEASGNVNLKTISSIAKTGVDYISVGALTHSVSAMDISLEVV
ncbi:nicotinate-nucleotide diphosphorylase (carboxylating) [Candidatus Cerribacteria bacterium 'Amazon FNV 2010 28 9']|uniref:Probable nicotinate-nucleotide pyrophosphorylase [carboxylating] n=1 Tax=Candidatus Cerribacteria bacterium 'Amazon FNV 2010 28 9' TaxID=2081795 RepID=A0A317JMJ6_9BACT|nr:MAG: nicotinate-nucleotide diphosphorylase (carboxylating) [Candidatus Cerribacteria bacterium 'Amazon FNV 2010 28 9']